MSVEWHNDPEATRYHQFGWSKVSLLVPPTWGDLYIGGLCRQVGDEAQPVRVGGEFDVVIDTHAVDCLRSFGPAMTGAEKPVTHYVLPFADEELSEEVISMANAAAVVASEALRRGVPRVLVRSLHGYNRPALVAAIALREWVSIDTIIRMRGQGRTLQNPSFHSYCQEIRREAKR